MSEALAQFEKMMDDVQRLLAHHSNFSERLPGKPSNDEGPLLRSCIVLIYAAWEYYFEESLIEVASVVAERPRESLPEQLRQFVSTRKEITNNPWVLAGEGWKTALVSAVSAYARGVENNPVDFGINNANAWVVEEAHRKLLGVSILRQIRWGHSTNESVRQRLDDLVRLRGEIAHGKGPDGPLHLEHVRKWIGFTERLVKQYDRRLFAWVEKHYEGLPVG